MRVLVTISKSPPHSYLVKLHNQRLIEEVCDLLGRRKHSMAVVTALTKGLFERVVKDEEIRDLDADLVISDCSAQWDLT